MRRKRRPVLSLWLALLCGACGPAWAQAVDVKSRAGKTDAAPIRVTLKNAASAAPMALTIWRAEQPIRVFLETQANDVLRPLALRRGMSVARFDLAPLPDAARADALAAVVAYLRGAFAGAKILAHGEAGAAAALQKSAQTFDGLLLHDAPPDAIAAPTRVIETFGADAYWRDSPPPAAQGAEVKNRRRFFLAGVATGAGGDCAAPVNRRDGATAKRALLVALDEWLSGTSPPPSRAPRPGDLARVSATTWPKLAALPAPPAAGRLAPKVDADGNEIAGLRLPDHALPIATHSGFNMRKSKPDVFCGAGATASFAATKQARDSTGDPRPSLTERYGSRAYFVATMRVVADKLVKERLLLQEDADAYVAAAKQAPF